MAQVSGQSCGHAARTTSRTVSLMPSFYVDELDPVAYRRRGAALQVREAADVRGGDDIRAAGLERGELAPAQLAGNRRLQERVGPGRAAAEMGVIHRLQCVPGMREQR